VLIGDLSRLEEPVSFIFRVVEVCCFHPHGSQTSHFRLQWRQRRQDPLKRSHQFIRRHISQGENMHSFFPVS